MEYKEKMATASTDLRDIQDGRVYQSFLQIQQLRRDLRTVFLVALSCDGAPLIKSRKFSMWAVMGFLVELPPEIQYMLSSLILTGLWYGKTKPNVPVFLKSFVNELSGLNHGCEFVNDNDELVPSVVRIQSLVPDLPTKSMLLEIKQFNGQFGCSTCKHPGTYVGELRTRIYTSTPFPLRTAAESHRLADIAEQTGTTVFGIKGKNVFGQLLSIPDNVPIDWMHCVCEGVLKRQLFHKWFQEDFVAEEYSLLPFKEELDEIFLSVKIPHDFTRKPRSFNDLKHWKASEFRLFLLFIGLPCLRQAVIADSLLPDHFFLFALLATAMRFLHSALVTHASVEQAQVLIDNFVWLLPILYGGDQECT